MSIYVFSIICINVQRFIIKGKFGKQYIGESERVLKNRLAEHIGYVKSKNINQPTGEHFNLPGHTLSNMNILILEKVKNFNTNYRKEREKYLIRKFNTYYNGMNKMP